MTRRNAFISLVFILILLSGCAGVPVRPGLKENLEIPAGRIDGNRFTGIRYPFNVTAPVHWKMSMEFPDFLEELGYDRPGSNDKEQNELYLFNPTTQSSLQIDFTPAGRYSTFSQEKIEALTNLGTGSFKEELEKEFGTDIKAEIGPTEAVSLKGVQFAAKKYATYTVRGVRREQGWIYAFTEPYQLFILYMIVDKEGATDRQDIKKILDSFEFMPKK